MLKFLFFIMFLAIIYLTVSVVLALVEANKEDGTVEKIEWKKMSTWIDFLKWPSKYI